MAGDTEILHQLGNSVLGVGFKYCLFSPRKLEQYFQFDYNIF